MTTADYVLKCTLKRKFGDFEKIECIGEGIVVLGCSPNCLKICLGRRWRNRTDLPRGFARLVALNRNAQTVRKLVLAINRQTPSAAITDNPGESEADRFKSQLFVDCPPQKE